MPGAVWEAAHILVNKYSIRVLRTFLCSNVPVPEYLYLGPLKAQGGFSVYRSTWLILQHHVHPCPFILSPHCSRATAENYKLSHAISSFFFSSQAILKDFSIIYTKRWDRLISTKEEKLTKCNWEKPPSPKNCFYLFSFLESTNFKFMCINYDLSSTKSATFGDLGDALWTSLSNLPKVFSKEVKIWHQSKKALRGNRWPHHN